MLEKYIKAARREVKADLVLKNATYADVFCGKLRKGDIAIVDEKIVGVGEYEGETEIDCSSLTVLPAYIDGHVHIESSQLSPEEFATLIVPRGTTAIIADPHEITNVCGTAGCDYILKASENVPLDVMLQLPSCVPATPFETSGAVLNGKDIAENIPKERYFGLGEFMNYPGVINCDGDVLQKLEAAHSVGKIIDGHAPSVYGCELNAYLCGGISTDHECVTLEEVEEKVSKGMYVHIRHGSSTRNLGNAKALTSFVTHPVRFLSRANDGTIAFTYDGELYTMKAGSTPSKVAVSLIDSDTNPTRRLNVSGARGAVASPDGKSVAFIYRGNVFVTSVEYPTTKQITSTPEAEGSVSWSPDSKALIYTSERDGKFNIYRATIAREGDEPNFANATLIKEEPLFKPDKHERMMADLSPDGKKLAFILDRTKLAVMDMATGKVTELTDGSTHRQRGGGFSYTWSPDSRWIALEIVDRMHDPYYDIAIINVEDGSMTNLTNSGYFDQAPRWAMDGNALIFASER